MQGDLSLIQKKLDKFSLGHPSNDGNVSRLALRGLNSLVEQCQLLSCAEGLCSGAREPAARAQSFERQVPVRSADSASARGDMTPLQEYITVAQRQLADVHSASVLLERECHEYHRLLGVEEQRCGSLEVLHRSLRNHLVDHASFVDSFRGFIRQDVDHDFDVYLWVVFAVVHDRTDGFLSATSSVVETNHATLHQDVSAILTNLDSRLAASTLYPPVTTSPNPLSRGAALSPS